MPRLLLIDDDRKLAALVLEYLEPQGFSIDTATDGLEGLDRALAAAPDLVILDLMLPGLDGLEVCRRLRARSAVPILMLTARGDETDRIVGLELGADDYLPKPFNPRELLARIRAILRRAVAAPPDRAQDAAWIEVDGLRLDPGARRVLLDDREIELTTSEFDLLKALAAAAGRVLSRDQLLQEVHGPGWAAYSRSVDVHISRLRHKIEVDARRPQRLKTIRGVGYQLCRRGAE
ncbi:MAG: response regulator transcription factor [Acidobacteriota bacterium]